MIYNQIFKATARLDASRRSEFITHREDFRPFAPRVPCLNAPTNGSKLGSHLASHEYMLFACPTKAECVLNTSFIDSEPIVCMPAHAIARFRSTGIMDRWPLDGSHRGLYKKMAGIDCGRN
jgi:predicted NodU family carbamoyl transferase